MVRGKKSQAAKKAAPKGVRLNNAVPSMVVTNRVLCELVPSTNVFSQATANPESFLGVGSYFISIANDYAMRNFLVNTSGLVTVYDQYKISKIEVYCMADSFTPPYRPVFVNSSVDYDDAVVGDWYNMSQRSNVKTTVLTVTNPHRLIGAFVPKGNFITQATDSPSNAVPQGTQWWDLANLTQSFNGIKIHAACQSLTSIRVYAKAIVSFRGKI